MTSPLQLKSYFFPVISIVANQAQPVGQLPELNVELAVNVDKDNENVFEITLDLKIDATEEKPSQYQVHLKAVGIFEIDPDFPNKQQVIAVTGASILYSASREFLLMVMSRGPWPPIMLSPISFQPQPPPVEHSGH